MSHLNLETLHQVLTQIKPKILILYCHGNEEKTKQTSKGGHQIVQKSYNFEIEKFHQPCVVDYLD